MQVFKTYFKVLKKMLPAIMIYATVFLIILVLINIFMVQDENKQFENSKVSAVIINNDGDSSFIDGFIKYMESYVEFVDVEHSEEAINDALFYREIVLAITIPKGFTDEFVSGGRPELIKETAPDLGALSIDNTVNAYFNTAAMYLRHNPELTMEEINSNIDKSLTLATKVSIDTQKNKAVADSSEYNLSYYNYLAYIMIACFIIGVSSVMLSFNNLEIKRRHHSSPISIKNFNFQLILGNLCFILCYMVLFIVAGYILNPFKNIDANTLLYWANALIFSIAVLSLSYLIGITVKSKNAVQALSTMVSLSLAFLSGIFVPQEFLGATVLKVASFTPSYWYVKGNHNISSIDEYDWNSLSKVFSDMIIQLGFAAAIFAIALVISKRNSRQAA